MRRFISFVAGLLVCSACVALEPQKIAVSELSMSFDTKQSKFTHYMGQVISLSIRTQ